MSNFYTFAQHYGSKILVRGVYNGKRYTRRADFKPVLYVKSNKQTPYKDLYGEFVAPVEFEDNAAAKEFIQTYSNVDNFPIFGQTHYGYQYLGRMFPKDIEWDISQVLTYTIDIETSTENGFPNVDNPNESILLITIKNLQTKKIYTWGCGEFTAAGSEHVCDKDVKYYRCKNEADLLQRFIDFWCSDYPDVITGWNINFFDIPYMIARVGRVLDDDAKKKFSPWGLVRKSDKTINGKSVTIYDITGVEQLDYLDLYKKFTYANQESYKLDFIAEVELGRKKLETGYDTFKELYDNDWQLFTEYNIIDVDLVDEMEDKMKLIDLALTMAFDAKCNFSDIFSQVRTWDCVVYNHLLKQNVVIPQKQHKQGRAFEGAYVKAPVPGHYDWVVSFDATSLYPSIIMQYNMSPETFINDIHNNTNVEGLLKKEFDLDGLKEKDYCMTSNGYCYSRKKQGFMPEIVEKMFEERQRNKKLMIVAQKEYELTKNKSLLKDISKYNNIQMARKIQLNSLFGAYGSEYFRYYDDRAAEGITITGQYIIREIGNSLNAYLNKICETTDYDYSFYSDTDSCYITLDPLVKKYYKDLPNDKIVDVLVKICNEKIQEALDKTCNEIADYTNAFQQKIFFKREAIADRGIWVSKKRYALNVYDNEGVRYKTPKLKVMGLEIVKSSTPAPVRETLREAVKICLNGNENILQKYIKETRINFMKLTPEQIAFPRGVNNLQKYTSNADIYQKATPMHVRGALLYNDQLKKHNLDKRYELIQEGDKIKFIYLKEPNTIRENTIAFKSKLPEEFNIHKYIDYDLMFEKAFLEPMDNIIKALGWHTEKQSTLEDLFT